MKKNTIIITMLMVAVIAVSCTKEPATTESTSQEYNICIEADFSATKAVADGGTATFATGDKVCVYNQTKAAVDANLLSAASNGASTTFTGTLAGTYSEGDVLQLFYNTTSAEVDYTLQDGTIGGVADIAVASVTVTGVSGGTVSTGKATFTNRQSIYKFTFKNGTTTLNVRAVTIRSAGDKLVAKDNLLTGASYGAVSISNATAQSAVYAALKFSSNPSETISFTLVDDAGIFYTGTKNSPAAGLADNKFYTSEVSVTPSATMPYPFTVANSPAKTVYLAAGSLYYKDSQYSFYPCKDPFHEPQGSLTNAERRDRSWFQWSVVNEKFASSSSAQDVYFNGAASKGWYVLSKDQFYCLVAQRSSVLVSGVQSAYNITTTAGILLPPDNATLADVEGLLTGWQQNSLSETQVLRYISKGFAFLRSSGHYYNENANNIGSRGNYWTSTSYSDEKAHLLGFTSSNAPSNDNQAKTQYYSVRLAHD